MSDIMTSINLNETTVGIFTDLTKAFDSVCWNKLFQKVKLLGIREISPHLLDFHLTNRHQIVENTNVKTSQHIYPGWLTAMQGVSQGPVLGPLLSTLYANVFAQISQYQATLYVVDTSVIIRARNDNPENEVISTVSRFGL
ncbi:hypothetical protein Trydic_g1191 [Trypoxylus dichotomus]